MKTITTYLKNHSFAFVACLFVASAGHAQSPTITSSSLPQIGYTYNHKSDTTAADRVTFTVSAGSSSAQTWNYATNFVTTYNESNSFVTPSTGTGNSNFPSATMTFASGTSWIYLVSNSTGIYINGVYGMIGSSPTAIVYNPNAIVLPTPFTYGNSSICNYAATYTFTSGSNNIEVRHFAKRNVSADAYGTITTPTATYTNCLRSKTYETTIDSIYVQVGMNWNYAQRNTDTTTSYSWIQNNINTLIVMQIDQDKKGKVKKAQYLLNVTNNGVATIPAVEQILNVYPNPSDDTVNLSYENSSAGGVEVDLYDLNGKVVGTLLNTSQGAGKQQINLDIKSLRVSSGLYFIRITNMDGVHTIKLSVN